MTEFMVEFDSRAMSALHLRPEDLAREVRIAAVVQWYAERRISQCNGAELLGISGAEFIEELSRRGVSYLQLDMNEMRSDAETIYCSLDTCATSRTTDALVLSNDERAHWLAELDQVTKQIAGAGSRRSHGDDDQDLYDERGLPR